MLIRRRGRSFSNFYKITDNITTMGYSYDKYIGITDYKVKIKKPLYIIPEILKL